VLFLYRPRQTYMPFQNPRNLMRQGSYNREIQERFDATRRVAPYDPSSADTQPRDAISQLKDLAELHGSGALTDAEFADAKATVLGSTEDST
jgi:hypothetical protein